MRLTPLAMLTLAVSVVQAGDAPVPTAGFERHFVDATLRVDYYHVGNADDELVTFDRCTRQGAWAGPRQQLADPFGYGGYLVRVTDPEEGTLLYSQGFDSYFGEYRTTDRAARGEHRTFHESVLLPFPRRPVRVAILRRPRTGEPTELAARLVDPGAVDVAAEPPAGGVVMVETTVAGPPAVSLDLTFVGEGYTADQEELFRSDLAHFSQLLLSQSPFASLGDRISVRGVLKPSADEGCDEPTRGVFRRTSVGASFNSLGSERYLLTEDNRSLRDIAANVPYDALVIMVNHDRYGGGGIYNLYCTFTTRSPWSGYLLVHELGHSFAGLADEYYTSSVAYNEFYPKSSEPVEPNITALLDPATLKWRHLVDPGTALPTPWEKATFDEMDTRYQRRREELNRAIAKAARGGAPDDRVEELERQAEELSMEHAERARRFLRASEAADVVGAFEGAGYSATGLYRPMVDCVMFSKGMRPFCAVCDAAVSRMIRRYAP